MNRVDGTTYPRKAVPLVRGASDDETGQNFATMLTSPEVAAYRIVRAVQPKYLADEIDVPGLLKTLRDDAAAVRAGNMSRAEAMLINQADALQAIFVNLAERASQQECLVNAEGFMKLALKAQSQCRNTLEALATIKNPPIVYARQANVTTGPQQINNGVDFIRTRENENAPNQLSGATNELYEDAGASCRTVADDPSLETMGEVYGAKNY